MVILQGLFNSGYEWWKILIDFYLVWIIALFLVKLLLSNSRLFNFALVLVIIFVIDQITHLLGLKISSEIYDYILNWFPLVILVIMAPDLRRSLEFIWKKDNKNEVIIMGNDHTREEIIEAVSYLSKNKIGGLITIEKHNTLDHFAEKAIMMHSQLSKEILINIFIPNTPLHDGAVIVRGNEILCAGAYFILSEREVADKTMGSRHRAALGISEVTDSLTIIVSEETGEISIAISGMLLKMNDRDKLMEYLKTFMR